MSKGNGKLLSCAAAPNRWRQSQLVTCSRAGAARSSSSAPEEISGSSGAKAAQSGRGAAAVGVVIGGPRSRVAAHAQRLRRVGAAHERVSRFFAAAGVISSMAAISRAVNPCATLIKRQAASFGPRSASATLSVSRSAIASAKGVSAPNRNNSSFNEKTSARSASHGTHEAGHDDRDREGNHEGTEADGYGDHQVAASDPSRADTPARAHKR
jgi:hypothetical protein